MIEDMPNCWNLQASGTTLFQLNLKPFSQISWGRLKMNTYESLKAERQKRIKNKTDENEKNKIKNKIKILWVILQQFQCTLDSDTCWNYNVVFGRWEWNGMAIP